MNNLNKDKRGQLFTLPIIIVLSILAILIIIAVLYFTSVNKYVVIGGGLIALTLIFGFKGKFTKTKGIFMAIFLVIGLALILSAGVLQSVFSSSQINVGTDGKVYWTFFASANSPNEQYVFTYNPTNYTKSDGSIISPKSNMVIVINPKQPQCIYQAQKIEVSDLVFVKHTYYTFTNPEKQANIIITDRDGKSYTMDATTIDSLSIPNNNGNGKVVVQTQGTLGGKFDCPSPNNVGMVINNDGTFGFYSASDLNLYFGGKIGNILGSGIPSSIPKSNFASTFISIPNYDGTKLVGGINFGYGTFTLTADQDYFNSVTYIPSTTAKPHIDSINVPSSIKQDSSSSMSVGISNNGDKGLVIVTASSSAFSIIPSSTNVNLDKLATLSFNLKAQNIASNGNSINVKVCSVSQFSGNQNCDSKSVSVDITSSTPNIFCGDGICQSNENFNVCPSDCPSGVIPPTPLTCKFYQESYTKDIKVWKWYNYLTIGLIPPQTQQQSGCRTAGWVYIFVLAIVIIVLGTIFILSGKKKRYKRRRR